MTFLATAALAIAALIAAPFLAHLLRRGRAEERDFPALKLVPVAAPVARQRTRLEDRTLLIIRAAMILGLALLGATPFIQCSRLSVNRSGGASVAIAIVIDDSASMQSQAEPGEARFQKALEGARQLIDSTREGDAIAIVSAGSPARLNLAATTDLRSARAALSSISKSDRDTDLAAATQLAQSSLERLPHVDKRIILLSDLAGQEIPQGKIPTLAPLSTIQQPANDCGVISAIIQNGALNVEVACSTTEASRKRSLGVRPASAALGPLPPGITPQSSSAHNAAKSPLQEQPGAQNLSLALPPNPTAWEVFLEGNDENSSNDACPISPHTSSTLVGVLSDSTRSSGLTGGPTLTEQALTALGNHLSVRPFALAPEEASELEPLSLLVLDDPTGLSPEARNQIKAWLEKGRVLLLFVGPAAARAQLSAKLEPFLTTTRWEPTEAQGLDPTSLSWLAHDSTGLTQLNPKGRSVLEGALPPHSQIVGRWLDGRPFMARQTVGRGTAFIVGLPVSASESDFALRPTFLALLEAALNEAERLGGPSRTVAGISWSFPANQGLKVLGPSGELKAEPVKSESASTSSWHITPQQIGRYLVSQGQETQLRIVGTSAEEIITQPTPHAQAELSHAESAQSSRLDISPQIALLLLGLLTLELIIRLINRSRLRLPTSRSLSAPAQKQPS